VRPSRIDSAAIAILALPERFLAAGARIFGAGRRGAFTREEAPCGRRAGSRRGQAFLVRLERAVLWPRFNHHINVGMEAVEELWSTPSRESAA
jgi:hypothetical protein